MELAGVDLRGRDLIVYSSSKIRLGPWKMNGWFTILEQDAAEYDLGQTVLEALSRSREDIIDPSWTFELPPFLGR